MDCNSIIYDAYNSIEKEHSQNPIDVSKIEEYIINRVIENIKEIIFYISPKYTVFITFDGVAPLAKMEQQRKRRYKSVLMDNIEKRKRIWNTASITPGTLFMDKLSKCMYNAFKHTEYVFGIKKMNISCSDEEGEGEHKMFQYIRDNNVKNDHVAIYGLDSDIMMLSLLHIEMTNGIKIIREAPEYMKKTERMLLDIGRLYNRIDEIMPVDDYIFLCFLLGNDFMPHNISLNIRRNGIERIIETYKKINRKMVKNTEIEWNNFYEYISELARDEEKIIIEENKERERMEKEWSRREEKDILLNLPILYRQQERYINVESKGWESRYYKELLKIDPTEENIREVCLNYLEGLEWVLKYYKEGKKGRWKYKYNYGGLLKDIKKNMKKRNRNEKEEKGINVYIQLAYVLPISQKDLIPNERIKEIMEKKEIYTNANENELNSAYCRYIWEAHPNLPNINIEMLENWNIEIE
jgi:5'-3' exonuclease